MELGECDRTPLLPYEHVEVRMRFKSVSMLGTYINDFSHRFHRICQITTYTAYVMLIEAGLTDVEQEFAEANPEPWLTNEFSNCFVNKGFALLDIGEQALVLYKHDDRWWLFNASIIELARFLYEAQRTGLKKPRPSHVRATCKLLDMQYAENDEMLRARAYVRLYEMIQKDDLRQRA